MIQSAINTIELIMSQRLCFFYPFVGLFVSRIIKKERDISTTLGLDPVKFLVQIQIKEHIQDLTCFSYIL